MDTIDANQRLMALTIPSIIVGLIKGAFVKFKRCLLLGVNQVHAPSLTTIFNMPIQQTAILTNLTNFHCFSPISPIFINW